jgi:hypothetical protein
MKILQVNRLVERENLRRESLESPSIAVLGLEVGECQKIPTKPDPDPSTPPETKTDQPKTKTN